MVLIWPVAAQSVLSTDYTDCEIPSASTAYLVDGHSYLFITHNGGKSWLHHYTQRPLDFIDFPDTLVGYGSSPKGADLWKTTDGGISWSLLKTFPGTLMCNMVDELAGFHFTSVQQGFAWGIWGVQRTSDGGSSWSDISSQFSGNFPLIQMAFLDELNGLALTGWHVLVKTSDGGITWSNVTGYFSYPNYRLVKRGSAGYAMCGYKMPGQGRIESWVETAHTDGAMFSRTYYTPGFPSPEHTPTSLGFFSGKRGLALCRIDSTYFISRDSGQTWLKRKFPFEMIPVQCCLSETGYGFAVGEWGGARLARTTDFGETWRQIDMAGTPVNTGDVECPDVSALMQSYPNPVQPDQAYATVPFSLANAAHVRLVLYDMMGRVVRTLRDGYLPGGRYSDELDVRGLRSGAYVTALFSAGRQPIFRTMTIRR
jgi:photosystem II stability/assembly factor-like uncharacterized protein